MQTTIICPNKVEPDVLKHHDKTNSKQGKLNLLNTEYVVRFALESAQQVLLDGLITGKKKGGGGIISGS